MPGKLHFNNEICLFTSDTRLICSDFRSKHNLAKNSEFCEFALDLHPI